MYSGQLDLARTALERALEVGPDSDFPHLNLAGTVLFQGKAAEALRWSAQIKNPFYKLMFESMARHSLGHAKESEDSLNELIRTHGKERPWNVAMTYAWRGDHGHAFDWLDRAYRQHTAELVNIKFVLVQNLRGDPRYTALLKKMNLPLD